VPENALIKRKREATLPTPLELHVDPNWMCQALAKFVMARPGYQINLMNLACDMATLCKYAYLDMGNFPRKFRDVLIGFNSHGATTGAFFIVGRPPDFYYDPDYQYVRCFFTQHGNGLECEWRELTIAQARRLIASWTRFLTKHARP
jgi:hypothetical protein